MFDKQEENSVNVGNLSFENMNLIVLIKLPSDFFI